MTIIWLRLPESKILLISFNFNKLKKATDFFKSVAFYYPNRLKKVWKPKQSDFTLIFLFKRNGYFITVSSQIFLVPFDKPRVSQFPTLFGKWKLRLFMLVGTVFCNNVVAFGDNKRVILLTFINHQLVTKCIKGNADGINRARVCILLQAGGW